MKRNPYQYPFKKNVYQVLSMACYGTAEVKEKKKYVRYLVVPECILEDLD